MIGSVVVSYDFSYRVNVIIRNEPLTGKFSYTLFDMVTGSKPAVQTQFDTFDQAANAAAAHVRELLEGSANDAETAVLARLLELRPE